MGAENKFFRSTININRQKDEALFRHEETGINLFAADAVARQTFQQNFLNLASSRLNEQFQYDESSIQRYYEYQAALNTYNAAELSQFKSQTSDLYNLNTRLAGLYQTANNAALQAATGGQVGVMNGNTAALMGYLGAAGSALDLVSYYAPAIEDWLKGT